MSVEFRLLGTVEAYFGGRVLDIGPVRQRCVLVALLVDANEVVRADQLVHRVWGDRPPLRGKETLRTYLARLRRALAVDPGIEIGRRSGGYVLTIDPLAVDLHRFRDLVGRARDGGGAELLEAARGLWRGEVFAGLDTPWITTVRAAVEAELVAVDLELIDARLERGAHRDLLPELTSLAAARPWDERVAGQLMLALYRSGRQADALEHYQGIRARLADELGADPSPPLRRLHQQVLANDPALDQPGAQRVPRQLPAAPRTFTGRSAELARLDEAGLGSAVVLSAIGGAGGVGKTWLALHWAHRNLARFPDGQLYADLRGFDASGTPATTSVLMRGFLEALGAEAIPQDGAARAALYRSLLAGRRMLLVLDNAKDSDQVVPLLPGGEACLVLVTSRSQLNGLVVRHGAQPVELDVLPAAEARELLARHIGAERLAAEPEATGELLRWCGGLPLALGIVGTRIARRPGTALAAFVQGVAEESARLDVLDGGELSVDLRAVFGWSADALEPAQAELFALLGLAPGPDIGLAAAAALGGLEPPAAQEILDALVETSLLHEHRPGRYRMHDLLRLFAAERARDASRRDAALRRLVGHYRDTAYAGDRLLAPGRPPLRPDEPATPFEDHTAALAWFEAEHACLLAAQATAGEREWHPFVWELAWATETFHARRGYGEPRLAAWEAGLAAATRAGNAGIEILAHRLLGNASAFAGRTRDAFGHLAEALAIAERTGDAIARADTHGALAVAHESTGDLEPALRHAISALELFSAGREPVRTANTHNMVGWFSARLGHYARAEEHCRAALALCESHGDRAGVAHAVHNLGYTAFETGDHEQAAAHYERAASLLHELGHTYYEADALDRLGQARAALGRADDARTAWRQALPLLKAQRRAGDVERVEARLEDR
ncbi:tetratricopeptide repeat protein [Amycolatopsis sp. OK19-0408]|uniref:Tetratricopeptide repeat protein n=1 Tax=Amycolatopsis iheyensis TaxID=2945988 RepID=A0A9X2NHX5_9PSEU|nr:BTAD domain-containing putative transcriptional regulator [Amycolatopsis iheyensis]MCR6489104.1 tetratricopeptide repeat protein [Amycolatopsis iheyensis]